MNKEGLLKILTTSFNIPVPDDFFKRLYEPEYLKEPLDENRLKTYCQKAIVFNYDLFGLKFIKGEISCTGLIFEFRSDRFEKISVSVLYDTFKKTLYNSVLATPRYTDNDWSGRKSINQRGCKVKSDKDFKRLISRLYKRFECPVLK